MLRAAFHSRAASEETSLQQGAAALTFRSVWHGNGAQKLRTPHILFHIILPHFIPCYTIQYSTIPSNTYYVISTLRQPFLACGCQALPPASAALDGIHALERAIPLPKELWIHCAEGAFYSGLASDALVPSLPQIAAMLLACTWRAEQRLCFKALLQDGCHDEPVRPKPLDMKVLWSASDSGDVAASIFLREPCSMAKAL